VHGHKQLKLWYIDLTPFESAPYLPLIWLNPRRKNMMLIYH